MYGTGFRLCLVLVHLPHRLYQWLFLVPVKGGRWHIIPQLAVYTTYIPLIYHLYTTYIPLIYCLLGGYIIPTTFYRNLKKPLTLPLENAKTWSISKLSCPAFELLRIRRVVQICRRQGFTKDWCSPGARD